MIFDAPAALTTLGLGFASSLMLIVSIGAQNAFVLRLGLTATRRIVRPVIAICTLSDAVLITAGVLGVGALITRYPQAVEVTHVVGTVFLAAYGLLALRRALRPAPAADPTETPVARGAGHAILLTLGFTWLNPHVYLDTVLLLGSIGNQQPADLLPWWVVGASAASAAWFVALGYGSRWLRPLFARPRAWRVLDGLIAGVMLALAVKIGLGA